MVCHITPESSSSLRNERVHDNKRRCVCAYMEARKGRQTKQRRKKCETKGQQLNLTPRKIGNKMHSLKIHKLPAPRRARTQIGAKKAQQKLCDEQQKEESNKSVNENERFIRRERGTKWNMRRECEMGAFGERSSEEGTTQQQIEMKNCEFKHFYFQRWQCFSLHLSSFPNYPHRMATDVLNY